MQSCPSNEETVDAREFRNALGRFATGVTVITTRSPAGKLEGLTANSFSALSLDPPLVLWSIRRSAPSLPGFLAASGFAVNVLAADQRELAADFATASIDKFADVPFAIGLRGYPILAGSIAVLECQTENTIEGGDHLIFIGRVVAASYCDGEPLVFSRGQYCVPVRHAPPPAPQRPHVWGAEFPEMTR
jgi:flavin reductase (DIM6/NTAB) family NADH-FMN oxidoreductase RutF